MLVFVLIEGTAIFVVRKSGSWLPRLLSFLTDRVVLVLAAIIVMVIVVTVSGAIVCYLVPLLS